MKERSSVISREKPQDPRNFPENTKDRPFSPEYCSETDWIYRPVKQRWTCLRLHVVIAAEGKQCMIHSAGLTRSPDQPIIIIIITKVKLSCCLTL